MFYFYLFIFYISFDRRLGAEFINVIEFLGEISRLVGNEWKSLPVSTKQMWEEKAAKCNEETTARGTESVNLHAYSVYAVYVLEKCSDIL